MRTGRNMDRVTREACGRRRTPRILATIALAAGSLVTLAPTAGAALHSCRARDVTHDGPVRADLQAVIDAAHACDTIVVRGVCVGNFSVSTPLTLVGKRTSQVPRPVLDADGAGRVLWVHASVSLVNLRLKGGNVPRARGGGIYNYADSLTLTHTVVIGNVASKGGGIYNGGTLALSRSSSVSGNTAALCGGIDNTGILTLSDTDVRRNTSRYGTLEGQGGGICNTGTLDLYGSSSVSENRAGHYGGGIYNTGTLTMHGSSSVSDNRTRRLGGGVYNEGKVTMRDSSAVRGNTCLSEGGGLYNTSFASLILHDAATIRSNVSHASGGGVSSFGTVTLHDV